MCYSLWSVERANNLHLSSLLFFSLLSMSSFVGSSVRTSPTGICGCPLKYKELPLVFTASYLHTSKDFFPLFASQSWQPSQYLKHKRERVHLNTVPACREMQNPGIAKKRRVPLRGPQLPSVPHMVGDQTSEEDSSQVLRKQWLFPAKHCRITGGA